MNPQPGWDLQDRLKVSQNELARLLGLSTGFMSQLLNGTRSLSPRTQRRIQRFFGDVGPDELFIVVGPDAQGPDLAVRIKREADSIADGTQVSLAAILPPGSTEMPKDFPRRLVAIKEATRLPWTQFAYVVGVSPRQMYRWRKEGAKPGGGAMLSLFRLVQIIPNGQQMLLGDAPQDGRTRPPRKDGR